MDAFASACARVIGQQREKRGIGTESEKTLHAVLKWYYDPDETHHEVPLGHYRADLFDGKRVVEIQTRQLYRLRPRLEAFLADYPVLVVHPLPARKWLSWVDPLTGERTPERLSPKRGTVYDAFSELRGLGPLLRHPRLSVCLLLIDLHETRLLDGWGNGGKRGSHRADRVPVALSDEVMLACPADYLRLLPPGLPDPFDAAAFAAAARVTPRRAHDGLQLLCTTGVLERAGRSGRRYLYRHTA